MSAFNSCYKKRVKNNKKILVTTKHIVFFIALLLGVHVTAQQSELGVPVFENISPSKISFDGPYQAISQDNTNIYISTPQGILYFNGISWNKIETPGKAIFCDKHKGNIFVGAKNFIGEITSNEFHQKELKSIITDTITFTGNVTKLVCYKNQPYFIDNYLLYTVTNGNLQQIQFAEKITSIFIVRERFFISTATQLYEFHSTTDLVPLMNESAVTGIYCDGATILRLKDRFVKLLSDNTIVAFPTEIDNILRDEFVCFISVNDDLIIGTKSHGIFVINSQGVVLREFSENTGFISNTINDILLDNNSNLWVATNCGLMRIEFNLAISCFNKFTGLKGNVKAIARYKGTLYVGTDRGIYTLLKGRFELFFNAPCNSLVIYNGQLIAGTTTGLYNVITKEHYFTNLIKKAFVIGNELIIITKDQISFCQESKGTYPSILPILQIPLPDIEITTIASVKADSLLFLGTQSDGLWLIQKTENGNYEILPCDWQGLPNNNGRIDVFSTKLGVLFATQNALFRCDSQNKFFYTDGKILIPEDYNNVRVTTVAEDTDANLWFSFNENGCYAQHHAVAWNTNNLDHYTLILAPFFNLREFHSDVIFPEDNSIVWLGGPEGLIRMDFNKMSVRKKLGDIQISKIVADKKESVSPFTQNLVFPFTTKSIIFEFSSVEYENHDNIQYSCYLEGQDDVWSSPSVFNKKEFTNLPAGKYAFHVIAQRPGGAQSNEAVFKFEIQRHPLLSFWAFAFYIAALLLFVYLQYKAYKKRLIQAARRRVQRSNKKYSSETKESQNQDNTESTDDFGENTNLQVKSDSFDFATVLFSDFKGFTQLTETLPAESLIQELELYFSEFDAIIEKYNIAKVKTLGDSYMCAGGIPKKNTTNPIEVVAAALEIQYRIREMQKDVAEDKKWGVRIGIHTGTLITGMIGDKQQTFDVWGDSVKIASLIEEKGEVGQVSISENTYFLIREFFDCEYGGKIILKNNGDKSDIYYVTGFKNAFADKNCKMLPNETFNRKLDLIKFEGLEQKMYSYFEEKLPKTLYYHNIKHTIDVVVQVENIGYAEGISDTEMYILKTAALFHDSGFINAYKNHEQESIAIARRILPKEGYSQEQIDQVCELINATILTEEPKNLLECIIRDADLDYLGREDYVPVSRELYKELLEHKLIKKNEYEWCLGQVKFLEEHKYYTSYSRSQRNPGKVRHLQKIQEQITRFNNIN